MQAEASGLGLAHRGMTPTPHGTTPLGVEGGPSSSSEEKGHVQDAGTRAPYVQSWFCWVSFWSFWLFVMEVTSTTGNVVDSAGISVVTVEVLALVILVGDS